MILFPDGPNWKNQYDPAQGVYSSSGVGTREKTDSGASEFQSEPSGQRVARTLHFLAEGSPGLMVHARSQLKAVPPQSRFSTSAHRRP